MKIHRSACLLEQLVLDISASVQASWYTESMVSLDIVNFGSSPEHQCLDAVSHGMQKNLNCKKKKKKLFLFQIFDMNIFAPVFSVFPRIQPCLIPSNSFTFTLTLHWPSLIGRIEGIYYMHIQYMYAVHGMPCTTPHPNASQLGIFQLDIMLCLIFRDEHLVYYQFNHHVNAKCIFLDTCLNF